MVRALASAALLGLASAAPAALREVSALVQRSAELHKPVYKLPKEVCSPAATADWEAKQKAHSEELMKLAEAKLAKARAHFNDTMTTLGSTIAQISAPLVAAYPKHQRLMAGAAKPMLSEFLRFTAMHFAQPDKNYSSVPETLDVQGLVQGVMDRIQKATPEEAAIVGEALSDFNKLVDERAAAECPEVAKELTRLTTQLPSTWEQITAFVPLFLAQKAVPFLICEAFPSFNKMLPAFMSMPQDPSKAEFWFKNSVLPALPEDCRKAEELFEVALGGKKPEELAKQSMPHQLAAFQQTALKCMDLALPKLEGAPAPPTKKCLTCEEYYSKKRPECVSHCVPTMLFSCGKGVTDSCMHGIAPCVECLSKNLKDTDACEGKGSHQETLALLDKLKPIIKEGSLEPKYVAIFADRVSKAILEPRKAA